MIVVSDTTPISELAKVGYLHLLAELYGQVIIPQEVYGELTSGVHPAATIVPGSDWIDVQSITNYERLNELQKNGNLDLGESAAIVLAEELGADQLLIDERAARRVAMACKLPVIGTIGVLVLAKQQGLIKNVKEILDALTDKGMRIGSRLYRQALVLAQEIDS